MDSITYQHMFFFFNDTATTEIYTLSLHDALPISSSRSIPTPQNCSSPPSSAPPTSSIPGTATWCSRCAISRVAARSEEHTSELQSQSNLVCRLLLEKKKEK